MSAGKNKIDLGPYEPATRDRIEKAVRTALRDKNVSLKFASADVAKWHAAADRKKESLTEWMERLLNAAIRGE